jgi:hypothetical protein
MISVFEVVMELSSYSLVIKVSLFSHRDLNPNPTPISHFSDDLSAFGWRRLPVILMGRSRCRKILATLYNTPLNALILFNFAVLFSERKLINIVILKGLRTLDRIVALE